MHLNFYTQYSYNKWHSSSGVCPLCQKCPGDIFHIILHCGFTNSVWVELRPILRRFLDQDISDQEKAIGLVNVKPSPGILLRNWVTFSVREQIMIFERKVYYSGKPSLDLFKVQCNQAMVCEVKRVIHRFNQKNSSKIDEVVAFRGILCKQASYEGLYTPFIPALLGTIWHTPSLWK